MTGASHFALLDAVPDGVFISRFCSSSTHRRKHKPYISLLYSRSNWLVKVAEEDGIALEPFNLKRERAEGHFDESGHYVEHGQDDAASRDAWLDSGALCAADPVTQRAGRG